MKTHKTFWTNTILILVLVFIFLHSCDEKDDIITETIPVLTTEEVTDITSNSALSGGNITDDGGSAVTLRGVLWSTENNPSMENHLGKTSDGAGSGNFTSNITGLNPSTTYYVRAYAANSEGTAYGNQITFKTEGVLATVTTADIADITSTSATGGGNVTDDGGAEVTARGIAYSTSPNPTTSDNIVPAGSGTGSFTSEMSGLSPGTSYYVRAYATNSTGTAYGEGVEFETLEEDDNNIPDIIYGDGVTDIDGNDYITVIIGNHEWMAQNLRATRYNNGDDIPTGLSESDWVNFYDGAYAVYPHTGDNNDNTDGIDSDLEMVEAYGKLYNWYAVNTGKLCPSGWRVPDDADWKTLKGTVDTQYGVDDSVWDQTGMSRGFDAGQKLKSCRQTNSPLGEGCETTSHPRWAGGTHFGTDDYGFSGLPGGFRHTGGFGNLGGNGYWWTATKHAVLNNNAWSHNLWFGTDGAGRNNNAKVDGFSVRCIKD